MNFSWTLMPPHLAGLHGFMSHPANNTILYAFAGSCVAESYDTGDTWTACWNKTGQCEIPLSNQESAREH